MKEEENNLKADKTKKKKNSKIVIIVNVVALLVIIAVAVYFIFFKNDSPQQMNRGAEGGQMGDIANQDIDDICENFQAGSQVERPQGKSLDGDFEPPEGFEGRGDRNTDRQKPEDMEERINLINEICEDGEVTEEERQKFEDLNNI